MAPHSSDIGRVPPTVATGIFTITTSTHRVSANSFKECAGSSFFVLVLACSNALGVRKVPWGAQVSPRGERKGKGLSPLLR